MLRHKQRAPRGGFARVMLGLVASVVTVMALAVPAHATPETDAADAINAEFAASGGPGGPLGAESGDVYPIGTGFARNYANGRIFFTPDTGARSMFGAVLTKYDELGGPADSDIGFPNANEATGLASPDSRYSTFSDGVIYYTPATGAWLVRGPINAAWDRLGSSGGALGVPTGDAAWNGPVLTQRFANGELAWNVSTGAYTSVPPELAGQLADLPPQKIEANVAINGVWRGAGGPGGPLGAKQGDLYPAGQGGIGQDFAGGSVFFSTATGPALVTGAILQKYLSLGGPGGELGFPTASETDGGIPDSRISSFAAEDKPVIFWTPANGAIVVRGAINAAWGKLGGAPAQIGVPVGEQSTDGDVVTQAFSGGEISWNSATQQYTTVPPELAAQLGEIQVPTSTAPPPTSAAASPEAADGAGTGFNWNWWWFAVPLLVLLIAVLGALLWRRERSKSPQAHGADESAASGDDHREYLPSPPPGRPDWRPDTPGNEQWGRGPSAPAAGTAVRDPEPDSEDEHGRHEVGAKLDGWGEGQDDIDTDSFAPVDELPSASRHSAAGDDKPPPRTPSGHDDTPTTSIPAGVAGPGQQRRTYGYESVPMFEPWRPEGDSVPPDQAPEAYGGQRHGDERFRSDRYSGVSYDEEPADDADYDDPRPTGRPQESVLQGAHLPLADRNRAPRGYPIKGDARSGHYYTPDNPGYASAQAEIWFDTEESARANGFFKDR